MSKLIGKIRVPADKSLSHRASIFSAIAEGTSHITGLLDSLDVRSTLSIIGALGAKIELDTSQSADGFCANITGWGSTGPRIQKHNQVLQCGNSGTTARLMLGLLSGYDIAATLSGDDSLSKRPMGRVTSPLAHMGARFEPEGTLPLKVTGSSSLSAISYESPVASAQVKSSILLAGLNAHGTTTVSEPHKSRDHTERMLPAYGVDVAVEGLKVSIRGGQSLRALDCAIPGDPSSAAFLLACAAMIKGSAVTTSNVLLNPTRSGFIAVMERMGVDIAVNSANDQQLGAEASGDITVTYSEELRATQVKASEIASLVDEVPILALLAAAAKGETIFENVGELRVKESDRLAAIIDGLSLLGIESYEENDNLHILGGTLKASPATFKTYGDHRLAMTWAIAERVLDADLKILNRESVSVSYPGFFADLRRLS